MTNQEMFDKAVRGLATQGFQRCVDGMNGCVYYNETNGMRCAWGHVDTSLTPADDGSISDLHHEGRGLAATLTDEQLNFARSLQVAHDVTYTPKDMIKKLYKLAERYGLSVAVLNVVA